MVMLRSTAVRLTDEMAASVMVERRLGPPFRFGDSARSADGTRTR
jgi:hypothetical protein